MCPFLSNSIQVLNVYLLLVLKQFRSEALLFVRKFNYNKKSFNIFSEKSKTNSEFLRFKA